MASPFKNPFFSIAGQKERLSNVGKVLNIAFNPFAKGKVEANVENKTLKKALEFGANNPYTTAGLVAGGVTAVKSVVTAGVKAAAGSSGATAISKGFAGATQPIVNVGKAVVSKLGYTGTTAGLVGTGVIVSSPTLRSKAIDIATHLTPENLLGSGAEIGRIIEDESLSTGDKAKSIVNTALGTTLTIGAAAVVGKEIYDYTQGEGFFGLGADKPEETKTTPESTISNNGFTPTIPPTAEVMPITANSTGKRKKRRYKPSKQAGNVTQNVKLYFDNDVNDYKSYRGRSRYSVNRITQSI